MVNVRLEKITKRFGDVIAADKITLTIKHGEFFTFLGPSGCGKTTTLRIIAGLEYPDEGKLYFDDRDVTDEPPYKRNTGMVFQNYALWPHMTVFDNVAYGLKIRKLPKEEIRRRVLEVLDLVKLRGLENRYPTQLSGGQQQRVAIASVLAMNPEIIVLDEPTSFLDPLGAEQIFEVINRLNKDLGITIILVEHRLDLISKYASRVIVMRDGRIALDGDPRKVLVSEEARLIGVGIPKATLLYKFLKSRGIDLKSIPLNSDEARRFIMEVIK